MSPVPQFQGLVSALFADRSKWTQNVLVRDAKGTDLTNCEEEVGELCSRPDVACWCVIGAIHKCYGVEAEPIIRQIITHRKAINPPEGIFLTVVNDKGGYDILMAVISEYNL